MILPERGQITGEGKIGRYLLISGVTAVAITLQPCLPILPLEREPLLELRVTNVDPLKELIIGTLRSRRLVDVQLHPVKIQPHGELVGLHKFPCGAQRLPDLQQSLA